MRNQGNTIKPALGERITIQAVKYGVAAFGGFLADYGALLMLKELLGLHYLLDSIKCRESNEVGCIVTKVD